MFCKKCQIAEKVKMASLQRKQRYISLQDHFWLFSGVLWAINLISGRNAAFGESWKDSGSNFWNLVPNYLSIKNQVDSSKDAREQSKMTLEENTYIPAPFYFHLNQEFSKVKWQIWFQQKLWMPAICIDAPWDTDSHALYHFENLKSLS